MMKYYAKLNENEICTEIVSTKKDLKGIRGFIEIPDYNETLIYKKWEGDQWSTKNYEPSVETKFQEKIEHLEKETNSLSESLSAKDNELEIVTKELQMLSGTLAELMMILGGDK